LCPRATQVVCSPEYLYFLPTIKSITATAIYSNYSTVYYNWQQSKTMRSVQ
jgi:hypothetical protein